VRKHQDGRKIDLLKKKGYGQATLHNLVIGGIMVGGYPEGKVLSGGKGAYVFETFWGAHWVACFGNVLCAHRGGERRRIYALRMVSTGSRGVPGADEELGGGGGGSIGKFRDRRVEEIRGLS